MTSFSVVLQRHTPFNYLLILDILKIKGGIQTSHYQQIYLTHLQIQYLETELEKTLCRNQIFNKKCPDNTYVNNLKGL